MKVTPEQIYENLHTKLDKARNEFINELRKELIGKKVVFYQDKKKNPRNIQTICFVYYDNGHRNINIITLENRNEPLQCFKFIP
jgi:hypothetical protein